MLRTRSARATEGQEVVQGVTRRDRNSDSAPRRRSDGFSSATALQKLWSGGAPEEGQPPGVSSLDLWIIFHCEITLRMLNLTSYRLRRNGL